MERLKTGRVLVTGGTGFIGSHLVSALVDEGNDVTVVYRHDDLNRLFFRRHMDRKVRLVRCDVRDFGKIQECMKDATWIFHLAAQAIVETAFSDPRETLETNIMGTVNILEAARMNPGVKGIIVASSDKAYGKTDKAYVESDPLRGDHPYEVSKSSCDLVTQTYAKTYGLPVAVARFGNVYGPGDSNESRIIPGIMKAVITGETLRLRSDGMHVRDYLYVMDVVAGYLFLRDNFKITTRKAFNFSSPDMKTVTGLIIDAGRVLGRDIRYVIDNTAINEIPYQHLDDSAIRALGWKNRYKFDDAIRETFDWYRTL